MGNLKKNIVMDEFLPSEFYLGQNYPNPFREKTIIKYCVAYKTRVRLTIYNSEGEEIERLIDEEKKPGTYEVEFQATVDNLPDGKAGRQLASGNYVCWFKAGDYSSQKEMILEK